MSTLEKIENAVVGGYKKIEEGVVEGYKKVETGVVEGYKKVETGAVEGFKNADKGRMGKMAEKVTDAYKKVEESVVEGYKKIEDGFVEKHLMKEGETVEEAKERIAKEQAERAEENKKYTHVEINVPDSSEIVKRNLEASKNAGKR